MYIYIMKLLSEQSYCFATIYMNKLKKKKISYFIKILY